MIRLTNKRIIDELLPRLEHRFHIWKQSGMDRDALTYNKFLSVTKYMEGKYDHADLSATIENGQIIAIHYAKEYTGCGNGYYAKVDNAGNIIAGEWD